jgi:hypothetical protein
MSFCCGLTHSSTMQNKVHTVVNFLRAAQSPCIVRVYLSCWAWSDFPTGGRGRSRPLLSCCIHVYASCSPFTVRTQLACVSLCALQWVSSDQISSSHSINMHIWCTLHVYFYIFIFIIIIIIIIIFIFIYFIFIYKKICYRHMYTYICLIN